MAFILAEDAALKEQLEGIMVTDSASAQNKRPVDVKFSYPAKEPSAREFPFIVVQLASIRKSDFREMRGIIPFHADNYIPDEEDWADYQPGGANEGEIVWAEFPIPHDLYYIVSTYSRYDLHDREIQRELIRRRIPYRGGWVPVDETVRMLQLISMQTADFLDNEKRTFRKTYTVRLESEVAPEIAYRKTADIETINLTTKWGVDINNLRNSETISF